MPQNQEVRLPAIVGERLLEIADYQRPYAWEGKQLADLWEDLDLLGSNNTHYAGTLVLRRVWPDGSVRESMSDDGSTLQHCEVVDGQQRLITCFLLLDRIRRRLDELERQGIEAAGSVARRIRDTYGAVSVDNAQVPRLRLGSGLNHYWVNSILGDEPYIGHRMTAGQERLKEAAAFFDTKIEKLTADVEAQQQFDRLRELQRRVTHGLAFLVYEVHSGAEVGVIFETLNERGRALTDLEKTKNYLLYLARSIPDGRSDQLAEEINKAWSDIFANLTGEGRGMDDQLLRAHWLATQNPDTRTWKRIDSIKQRFDRSKYIPGATRLVPHVAVSADQDEAWSHLFSEVHSYISSLRACSFFLAEMLDPNAAFEAFSSGHKRARRRSAALRRSGVVAVYRPLLFAARLRHPNDGEFYADLVDACERYSARVFVIEQRRTNAGEPALLRRAHELYSGADPQNVLAEVYAVLRRYASDNEVRATLGKPDENWYVRRGHKYVLYEYERDLMSPGEELPALSEFTDTSNKEQRTTEHILPQRPKPDADCWWNHFTEDQHAELVHSLGNLTLTHDNSVYSNKCFAEKKGTPAHVAADVCACYAQGRLHQERELARYTEWTPESIRTRQQAFAEWALQRWAVPPPTGETEPAEDIDIEHEGTEEDELSLEPTGVAE